MVARRPDGYHDLQTVFYPIPLCDALEIQEMDQHFPSEVDCDLKVTGIKVEGDEQQNLVVRAYRLLKQEFPDLPRLHVHLQKGIPTQAGMGGGSSDASAMLVLLNRHFCLGLTEEELVDRAAKLGADCPFFILNTPAYAEGIGERLKRIDLRLDGWYLAVVRPDIPVSTREAFALIHPKAAEKNCMETVQLPVAQWRHYLVNDFEYSVFAQHPAIGQIKEQLYDLGAVYAAMSGSGSAVFGLFREMVNLEHIFANMYTRMLRL